MEEQVAPGSYGYFAHDADIGVIGAGHTMEQAMEQAARATFALMGSADDTGLEQTIHLDFDEADPGFALVTWLNQLIAECRVANVLPAAFELHRDGEHWSGIARGPVWTASMERGVEAKGATLTMLAVEQRGETWEARCVVDV